MTEATLKSALVKDLRYFLPGYVILRHEDRITHGIPDITVTGSGKTTWIEAKFANPKFQSRGIQELTLSRLALAGSAFYIVWSLDKFGDRLTYIVSPKDIGKPMDEWENVSSGIDHKFVIDHIRRTHDHVR